MMIFFPPIFPLQHSLLLQTFETYQSSDPLMIHIIPTINLILQRFFHFTRTTTKQKKSILQKDKDGVVMIFMILKRIFCNMGDWVGGVFSVLSQSKVQVEVFSPPLVGHQSTLSISQTYVIFITIFHNLMSFAKSGREALERMLARSE